MDRLQQAVEKCREALISEEYRGDGEVPRPVPHLIMGSINADVSAITPVLKELCDDIDMLASKKDYKFLDKIYAQQQEIDRLKQERKNS